MKAAKPYLAKTIGGAVDIKFLRAAPSEERKNSSEQVQE